MVKIMKTIYIEEDVLEYLKKNRLVAGRILEGLYYTAKEKEKLEILERYDSISRENNAENNADNENNVDNKNNLNNLNKLN